MSRILGFLKTPLGLVILPIAAGAIGWIIVEIYSSIKKNNEKVELVRKEITYRVSKMKNLKPCNLYSFFLARDMIDFVKNEKSEYNSLLNDYLNREFENISLNTLIYNYYEDNAEELKIAEKYIDYLNKIGTLYDKAIGDLTFWNKTQGAIQFRSSAEHSLWETEKLIGQIETFWFGNTPDYPKRDYCGLVEQAAPTSP